MEFVMNNIMWFIFAGIILLMTMIGYYAEKTDFGRNVDDDNKKPKKEKKPKNNKKEEPAGIPVLENIDVEKNIGNNSVIENTNPLDEEVTNIENNNLDNVSLETVNEINEENNNTDTVTNDNQEVTQLENSQKEDIISEPVIEEVVTDIVEEKKEDVVSEPKIENVTTETVEEEKTEDNVSKTVVDDEKDNETNEVQEELPSIDELMNPTTEDEKVVSENLKVEENIESAKNEEISSESINSEEIKENNIEENVVEDIDNPSLKIEELPTEVEYQEEVSTENEVDDSHPVEEEVGISEIDAENLPVKIDESVTVSENNNSDIPEVSIDEIKEQQDVTVEKPQKKSWFGKKKSKKVDIPVDIGIREADSNEVLENTKEPDNNSNDEDDIWKF